MPQETCQRGCIMKRRLPLAYVLSVRGFYSWPSLLISKLVLWGWPKPQKKSNPGGQHNTLLISPLNYFLVGNSYHIFKIRFQSGCRIQLGIWWCPNSDYEGLFHLTSGVIICSMLRSCSLSMCNLALNCTRYWICKRKFQIPNIQFACVAVLSTMSLVPFLKGLEKGLVSIIIVFRPSKSLVAT